MGDLATYSLVDFIPFTSEVYARLFVRHNEALWPAQVPALLVGLAALRLAGQGRGRTLSVLLAACWVLVGYTFHLNLFANLNWAATYFGWAFVAEGALVLVAGLLGYLDRAPGEAPGAPGRLGLALAAFGLVAFPLVGPFSGEGWRGVQLFGIAPDPTAIATVGLLLAVSRTPWPLLLVPVLWCGISAATGWVVGAPGGVVAGAAALAGLGVAIGKARVRRRAASPVPEVRS